MWYNGLVLVGLAFSGCSLHSIVWQAEVENNVSFVFFPYGFLCRSSFMDQRSYLGSQVFKNILNFCLPHLQCCLFYSCE